MVPQRTTVARNVVIQRIDSQLQTPHPCARRDATGPAGLPRGAQLQTAAAQRRGGGGRRQAAGAPLAPRLSSRPLGASPKRPARPAAAGAEDGIPGALTPGPDPPCLPPEPDPGSEAPPRRRSTAKPVSTQPRVRVSWRQGTFRGPQTPDRGATDGQAQASGQQRGAAL